MSISKNGHLDQPLINRFYFNSEDYDEFVSLYTVANIEEKILEDGQFKGELSIIHSPNVVINYFKINKRVLQFGMGAPGFITFTIWDPKTAFNWKKNEMKKGMIGVIWKNEHQCVTGSDFIGLPIAIEENFFINLCRNNGYPELPDYLIKNEILLVPEGHLNKLRQMVRFLVQATDLENHIVMEFLEGKLLECLVDGLRTALPVMSDEDLTYSKFSQIIDYVHDNLTDLTSVQQISENTKVPERTIRRLIQKKYNLSLKNYLNKLRLNEVRKNLLKDSDYSNIMQVASEYNFWHMGQFSRDYKNLFGELPSDTIRSGV